MNAKQRRRLVRQHKEQIEIDRVVRRLEGSSTPWYDATDSNNLHRYKYDGEPIVETVARLNYYYALYIKGENANDPRIKTL
jgi:hypothetical protein